MEKTIDELQIIINEARVQLSKESGEAIDSVDWKLTVLGMNQKYNPEQLENLKTETELLLSGILNPQDYPIELENRMKIPKTEVVSLINELDKLIFKKIQEQLEKIIDGKENVPVSTPINGNGEKTITNDELRPIKENVEDEVPLPPYAKIITNDQLPITDEKKVITDYKLPMTNDGISNKEETPKENPIVVNKPDEELKYIPKNVFEDKMKSVTTSEHATTDHSKPRVDPYREEF